MSSSKRPFSKRSSYAKIKRKESSVFEIEQILNSKYNLETLPVQTRKKLINIYKVF